MENESPDNEKTFSLSTSVSDWRAIKFWKMPMALGIGASWAGAAIVVDVYVFL
jgi:hypothetical protein